jgi:hypothetical protein
MQALVLAKNPGGTIHDWPTRLRPGDALNEAGVVAIRHKADLHTFRLSTGGQLMLLGDGAHLGLAQVPDRERQVGQCILSEGEEEVTLVLGFISRPAKMEARLLSLDLSVVPGRKLGAQGEGALQQEAELHIPIARHARDRCAPAEVRIDKGLDYTFPEQLFSLGNVERNPKLLGHCPSVVDVLRATAASAPGGALVGPDTQGHANDFMALFLEQRRCHGGIHPATHCHDKPHELLLVLIHSLSTALRSAS